MQSNCAKRSLDAVAGVEEPNKRAHYHCGSAQSPIEIVELLL
jgi:hypothetical protein